MGKFVDNSRLGRTAWHWKHSHRWYVTNLNVMFCTEGKQINCKRTGKGNQIHHQFLWQEFWILQREECKMEPKTAEKQIPKLGRGSHALGCGLCQPFLKRKYRQSGRGRGEEKERGEGKMRGKTQSSVLRQPWSSPGRELRWNFSTAS